MTDEGYLNNLQERAVDILMKETFTHVRSMMNEQYVALGRQNANLNNTRETRFINGGIIYPPTDIKTIPYGSRIPTLHYSLLGELAEIGKMSAEYDYHYIKNFFVACISQSHNSIVLADLLPAVLVNSLKLWLPTQDFKILDTGVCGRLKQEPISITRTNLQAIRQHYQNTITLIQHMLMDKLLLQK